MSKNKRDKVKYDTTGNDKSGALVRLIFTLIVLCVAAMIFIRLLAPTVKHEAKKIAAEKTVDVITEKIDTIAADNPEVKEIVNNLSEEDKQVVTDIITEHMDTETMSEVMEYVGNKDKEGLMKYAKENLSEEELEQLIDIFGKASASNSASDE
jgi:hypothetical protein